MEQATAAAEKGDSEEDLLLDSIEAMKGRLHKMTDALHQMANDVSVMSGILYLMEEQLRKE